MYIDKCSKGIKLASAQRMQSKANWAIYTAHNISFWPGVIITDSRIIRLSFTLWQDRKDSCWLPCLLSTAGQA